VYEIRRWRKHEGGGSGSPKPPFIEMNLTAAEVPDLSTDLSGSDDVSPAG
jgi:hypothetical protein